MMDLQLNPDEEQDDADNRAIQTHKEMCLPSSAGTLQA
jgi:hypothetical protein